MTDPLPSLSRVRSALGGAPIQSGVPRPRLPGFEADRFAEPKAFLQAAYQTALGRTPSELELQRGVGALSQGTSRQDWLRQLVGGQEFVQRSGRVDTAFQAGIPVRVDVPGQSPQTILWPYAPGSRHGGPEKLANQGDPAKLRDALAPFATYFGAGTRGSLMLAVQDLAAQDSVHPGSKATQELGEIARSLFWDIPMQQNSDETLRRQGVGPSLSEPDAMISYLGGQQSRIQACLDRQDPLLDGPLHRQAGQELKGMVEAALGRTQAFKDGDHRPIEAQSLGDFGIYDAARPAGPDALRAGGPEAMADPTQTIARLETESFADPARQGPESFSGRLRSHLIGD